MFSCSHHSESGNEEVAFTITSSSHLMFSHFEAPSTFYPPLPIRLRRWLRPAISDLIIPILLLCSKSLVGWMDSISIIKLPSLPDNFFSHPIYSWIIIVITYLRAPRAVILVFDLKVYIHWGYYSSSSSLGFGLYINRFPLNWFIG